VKVKDIVKLLNAKVLTGEDKLGYDFQCAYAADLLSDVLALTKEKTVLITGATNSQVIRVAEILDIPMIILVRGKLPSPETIEFAKKLNIPIIATSLTMFETCGLLYSKGIRPCKNRHLHKLIEGGVKKNEGKG